MTESTMTIRGGGQSVTFTSEEAREITKNIKNGELFPVKLKQYTDRILKLSEEKKELQDCITSVYEEAAGKGFDKKALRDAIKMLKMEKGERDYHLELTTLYLGEIA